METGKDIGEILYNHTTHDRDSPVLVDRAVLNRFHGDFNYFFEHILPVWKARYYDDESKLVENDPKIASDTYFFVGHNVYAKGSVLGHDPNFFPFVTLSSIADEIYRILDGKLMNSIVISALDTKIRNILEMEISNRGLIFENGVIYRSDIDELIEENQAE